MIAFIPKNDYQLDIIRRQLKDKNIDDIVVLPGGSDVSKYDNVVYDVEPNKETADIFDLGNNLMTHGFPDEDPQFDGYSNNRERSIARKKDGLKEIGDILIEESGNIEISPKILKAFKNKVEYYKTKKYQDINKEQAELLLNSSTKIEDVLLYSAWLYNKTYNKIIVERRTYEWVLNYVSKQSESILEYDLLVKMYKKRAKQIILKKKKYASLKFYIDWLVDESRVPFTKVDIYEDDDEELPF